jgi:hypothetical protein
MLGPFIFEGHLADDIYRQFLQNELSYLLEDVLFETKCVCIFNRMEHLLISSIQWTLSMIINFLINGSFMVITAMSILITRPQPPRPLFVGGHIKHLIYQQRV